MILYIYISINIYIYTCEVSDLIGVIKIQGAHPPNAIHPSENKANKGLDFHDHEIDG